MFSGEVTEVHYLLAMPCFLERVIDDCADKVSTELTPGPDREHLLELVS